MKKPILVGILLLCTSVSMAAPEKISRAATKADLVGTWEMVSVRPVADKNDPTYFPYQRFAFQPDSSMKVMVADKPFTKEWADKFKKTPASIDYSLNEKGILTLSWQQRPHSEQAVCGYVMRDIPSEMTAKLTLEQRKQLPKKGNITLGFLSGGKIAYQKVLTKIA